MLTTTRKSESPAKLRVQRASPLHRYLAATTWTFYTRARRQPRVHDTASSPHLECTVLQTLTISFCRNSRPCIGTCPIILRTVGSPLISYACSLSPASGPCISAQCQGVSCNVAMKINRLPQNRNQSHLWAPTFQLAMRRTHPSRRHDGGYDTTRARHEDALSCSLKAS